MKTKYPDFWLWVCLIILLLAGLGACVYSAINPSFSAASVLSGYATFAIALLTVVYVATTRHQLWIMTRQLGEMMRARELQAQPLPWPISVRVFSERPQLLLNPLKIPSEWVALIRHIVEVRIRNIGTSPAISVDISCRLKVPIEVKPIEWPAVAVRAEVIEEKHEYPEYQDEYSGFLFSDDTDGHLLTAILDNRIDKLPQLHIHVLYRNTLGGCFQLRRVYKLYPRKDNNREILISWLERIHNFPVRHKEDLDLLSRLRSSMDQRAEKMFKDLKEECQEGLSKEEIDYDIWSVPASGEISSLTGEQYAQAVREISYGFRIDSSYICPVPERQEKGNGNDVM